MQKQCFQPGSILVSAMNVDSSLKAEVWEGAKNKFIIINLTNLGVFPSVGNNYCRVSSNCDGVSGKSSCQGRENIV